MDDLNEEGRRELVQWSRSDIFPRSMFVTATSTTRFSFIYLLFKFWRAILSLFAGEIFFLCYINYLSLNIDIAQVFLNFYFTFPDSAWIRQHPATNGGTGNCGPFFSTPHYFQAQLSTVFHRARLP